MTTQQQPDRTCCPPFDPALWDDRMVEWNRKLFIKDHVFTFFYLPVNFSKVMKLLDEKVKKSGANIPDGLCLSDHTSPWNMNVYLAVDKELFGVDTMTLSGKFYSRVYEGPFNDTGKWCNDYKSIAASREYTVKKLFMWYTTCPKCAKKTGKNYVVILGQVT
jgi:hypothetical protein